MLEVTGLDVDRAGNGVLHGVTLRVGAGEVVALIGSNGAGKTTLLSAVCGLLAARAGSVRFDGQEVLGTSTHELSRRGLAYVPAERHLFPTMTVDENLTLGAHPHRPDAARLDMVRALFPRLGERATQLAGTMSGGEQQMLAVGRALMGRPRLLLLDEPSTGLAPAPAADAYAALAVLASEGTTILVAEQQVARALRLADRGYVLEDGHVVLEGTAGDLAGNDDVRRAYLGIS